MFDVDGSVCDGRKQFVIGMNCDHNAGLDQSVGVCSRMCMLTSTRNQCSHMFVPSIDLLRDDDSFLIAVLMRRAWMHVST